MITVKPLRSITLYLLAGPLIGFFFTSCSKNNSNSGSSGGSFTATVNGASFQSVVAGGQQVSSANLFFIAGESVVSGDTIELSITMPDSIALNTPVQFDGFTTTLVYDNLKTGAIYATGSTSNTAGSVTVASLNQQAQQVSGSFSGTVYNQTNANDSLVITSGKFNILYTND
jgi:hypothetical protein